MSPTLPQHLLHRLAVGDAAAIAAIVEASRTSDDADDPDRGGAVRATDRDALLARAGRMAATTRDRQLVVIATAHLRGERDRVDALARDHLVDHPDNVLVAWIADRSLNAVDRSLKCPVLATFTIRVRPATARRGRHAASRADARCCGARSSSCRSD